MTPITQQIDQLEEMASRHYPDDENQRNAYLVSKLKERLMEFAAMVQALPVREMKGVGGVAIPASDWVVDKLPSSLAWPADTSTHKAGDPGAKEVCRFPDCRCPMDPGPADDWCARGLPHEKRSQGRMSALLHDGPSGVIAHPDLRCIGHGAGPSGHQLRIDCEHCHRRTAPRAGFVVLKNPPQQFPCPIHVRAK